MANKRFSYYCNECKESKVFEVKYAHGFQAGDYEPIEYSYAVCDDCAVPAFFVRDYIGGNYQGDHFGYYVKVYPNNPRKLNYFLPDEVEKSYREAIRCEENKTYIAAATMAGRTLEAICRDKYPDTSSIFKGLNHLKESGLISQEMTDWGHALRVMRNYSAHASGETITKEDISDGLDFLQSIIHTIYYIRPKFYEYQVRNKTGQ